MFNQVCTGVHCVTHGQQCERSFVNALALWSALCHMRMLGMLKRGTNVDCYVANGDVTRFIPVLRYLVTTCEHTIILIHKYIPVPVHLSTQLNQQAQAYYLYFIILFKKTFIRDVHKGIPLRQRGCHLAYLECQLSFANCLKRKYQGGKRHC